jgi:trk system potassium uptake protein TrkH
MALFRQFPALVLLLIGAAGLMLVPALHAAHLGNWPVARVFLYHGVFFILFGIILGLATMNRQPRIPARYALLTLLLAYLLLPLVLAAPVVALVPTLGLGGGYFEMLSCLTTTGATLFNRPQILPESVHLWRSLVGWSGGFLVLVVGFAIFAPLNLGGFEIGQGGEDRRHGASAGSAADMRGRIRRGVLGIGPLYGGMTGVLTLLLIFAGDRPFVALCHAMATLSTSSISPVGGLAGSQAGRLGELAIAVFFLPAITYRVMYHRLRRRGALPLAEDPQVQLMLIIVVGVTVLLFLRSFIGAVEIDRQDNLAAVAQAVWGSVFTVLSYLTTSGFVSHDWNTMQVWSSLPDPGIILLGVAVIGGGIATTAGGVKLLRIFALYRHGLREMDKLIHPRAVGRRGQGDRLISGSGARVAFLFLMLFLISIALVMIALGVTGQNFQRGLALAIAGLTTTGPAGLLLGDGFIYRDLDAAGRAVFCAAMVVGRIEALVIIALFNPTYWRS